MELRLGRACLSSGSGSGGRSSRVFMVRFLNWRNLLTSARERVDFWFFSVARMSCEVASLPEPENWLEGAADASPPFLASDAMRLPRRREKVSLLLRPLEICLITPVSSRTVAVGPEAMMVGFEERMSSTRLCTFFFWLCRARDLLRASLLGEAARSPVSAFFSSCLRFFLLMRSVLVNFLIVLASFFFFFSSLACSSSLASFFALAMLNLMAERKEVANCAHAAKKAGMSFVFCSP
mmetsp:Transcript_6156/g.24827  ORF Transcript_6156/g.24827 Transcript_6156/m.24827 type:complete len:237 (+) Transcript_6156:72-782(+)